MTASEANLGIVAGADGSAPSRIALNWAARQARARHLGLTVVHAVAPQDSLVTNRLMVFGVREMPHRRVRRIIDDAVNIVEDSAGHTSQPPVITKVVVGDPVDILSGLSREAELVVVGASRRWVSRGSVGSTLVSRSQCPLAIIRDTNRWMPHPAHSAVSASVTGWSNSGDPAP